MKANIWIYIAVMALVTYGVRVLPLTLIRRQIHNVYIRSFLHYVPYVTLAVMTFPAILYATTSIWSGAAALLVAAVLAYCGKNLFVVSGCACATVFLVELLMNYIL